MAVLLVAGGDADLLALVVLVAADLLVVIWLSLAQQLAAGSACRPVVNMV